MPLRSITLAAGARPIGIIEGISGSVYKGNDALPFTYTDIRGNCHLEQGLESENDPDSDRMTIQSAIGNRKLALRT